MMQGAHGEQTRVFCNIAEDKYDASHSFGCTEPLGDLHADQVSE